MGLPAIQRAEARAARTYKSPGFRKAYRAGAVSALAGRPADDCPYDSRSGWRAWRNAWLAGWRSIPAPR